MQVGSIAARPLTLPMRHPGRRLQVVRPILGISFAPDPSADQLGVKGG